MGSLGRSILASIPSALQAARGGGGALRALPHQERELPITWVAGGSVRPPALRAGGRRHRLAVAFGFLVAAACGYPAGLLGSSSSPISGIGILTTLPTALLLPLLLGHSAGPEGQRFVVASALLLSAIVLDRQRQPSGSQDRPTRRCPPWRQQVALAAGVIVGAGVIAPLLDLLYNAYGFAGAPPREGMDASAALPAPQAALMTQIAEGIVRSERPWSMVATGDGRRAPGSGRSSSRSRRACAAAAAPFRSSPWASACTGRSKSS